MVMKLTDIIRNCFSGATHTGFKQNKKKMEKNNHQIITFKQRKQLFLFETFQCVLYTFFWYACLFVLKTLINCSVIIDVHVMYAKSIYKSLHLRPL